MPVGTWKFGEGKGGESNNTKQRANGDYGNKQKVYELSGDKEFNQAYKLDIIYNNTKWSTAGKELCHLLRLYIYKIYVIRLYIYDILHTSWSQNMQRNKSQVQFTIWQCRLRHEFSNGGIRITCLLRSRTRKKGSNFSRL